MSYEAIETGALGNPTELFFFKRRGVCWPYTSADQAQVLNGMTFNPVTISRGAFDRADEAGSSTVQIQIDRKLKVCTQFLSNSTPYPVEITIYRRHRSDADYIIIFRGIVANAELAGEEVSLTCASPLSADEKSIPRHLIMRTCPHVLYGPRCALNRENFKQTGQLWATPTSTLVKVAFMPDPGDDYYTAGIVYHQATGTWAFIQDHRYFGAVNELYLLQPPVGWAVWDYVDVYAGCDRKHTTCRDRFGNIANFGGFPLHPERNPLVDLEGDN